MSTTPANGTTCVILQPSYIPWRGAFDQVRRADVFVFYDDVQYDKHGWRNRNRIKTPAGTQWLTIPVNARGNVEHGTPINQVAMCHDQGWARKHWERLRQTYGKAPYFKRYAGLLEEAYRDPPELLADFTIDLTVKLARELGITGTRFVRSSEIPAEGSRTDRLMAILAHLGATHYVSGPSAKDYLDEGRFAAAGIGLEYMAYDYPEYPQLYPPFDPKVTVLDLLFMTGAEAPRYIWGPGPAAGAA
jgi:hypothetical protein